MIFARLCFYLPLLLLAVNDCRGQSDEFESLWGDVVSKLHSRDSGIGPFPNAVHEFGPNAKSKRFAIFERNKKELQEMENLMPRRQYETSLNFFALLDKSEWGRYLSNPDLNLLMIWQELYKFILQPPVIAHVESDDRDFSEVRVSARHSGAFHSRGIMTAVMHLEYLYKHLLNVPQSELPTFSSQYFLNCIRKEQPDPTWPDDVWSTMLENNFAAEENVPGMSWTGVREQCKDDTANAFDINASVTTYHMLGAWKHIMEDYLKRGPLTVCVYVDVTDPLFFFYRSGLYTDITMGTLFKTCNHFVLFVNYEETHFLVQNTWGLDWGNNGKMHVARNSLGSMEAFLMSYPIMKYDDPPPLVNEYSEVGGQTHVRHYNDYFLSEIKDGHVFEIRSNSTVEKTKRFLRVKFVILTHTKSIYYGIRVSFRRRNVLQYGKLHKSMDIKIFDDLTKAMDSPDSSPDITVLRIVVEQDHFTPLLNDQPLTQFPHQHDFKEINLLELISDGKVEFVHLEKKRVPNLFPNSGGMSGGEVCRNKELEEDCEKWQQYGYCGEYSQYKDFMAQGCPLSCSIC